MEMGLSLFAQSHLPNLFWVDAFLHSTYIINRLPTPLLSNDSPFSKLFHHSSDYSLFCIFGCASYPLLRPLIYPHKLAFKSKQCVFLRFNPNHKGYRCFDPISHSVPCPASISSSFICKDSFAWCTSYCHPNAWSLHSHSCSSKSHSLSLKPAYCPSCLYSSRTSSFSYPLSHSYVLEQSHASLVSLSPHNLSSDSGLPNLSSTTLVSSL